MGELVLHLQPSSTLCTSLSLGLLLFVLVYYHISYSLHHFIFILVILYLSVAAASVAGTASPSEPPSLCADPLVASWPSPCFQTAAPQTYAPVHRKQSHVAFNNTASGTAQAPIYHQKERVRFIWIIEGL